MPKLQKENRQPLIWVILILYYSIYSPKLLLATKFLQENINNNQFPKIYENLQTQQVNYDEFQNFINFNLFITLTSIANVIFSNSPNILGIFIITTNLIFPYLVISVSHIYLFIYFELLTQWLILIIYKIMSIGL